MGVSVPLTIPAGKVTADLTGFVVRVDLAHLGAAWWADTTTDLGNVRVKQADSVIPFDVVVYDRAAKTGELFFRAPSLLAASDNVFTVETVNGATALAATDTNGRNAVWVDYDDVYVFESLVSRTGSGRDMALVSSATQVTVGSNPSKELSSAGNGYAIATTTLSRTTWTMAASYTPAAIGGSSACAILTYGTTGTGGAARATMAARDVGLYGVWNSANGWMNSAVAPVVGARRRLHHTQSGTASRKIYVDGVATVSGAVSQRPVSATRIYAGGSVQSSAENMNGTLQYAYWRNGELSADWIAAEVASWETPGSFYSVPTDATAAGGTAHETDTAAPGAITAGPVTLIGGTAHETDTASTGAVSTATMIPGGTAHETDTAAAATATAGPATITSGTAHETDTARPGATVEGDPAEPPSLVYGFAIAGDLEIHTYPPVPDIPDLVPAGLIGISAPTPTLVDGSPL